MNDAADHWKGMPSFEMEKVEPYKKITIRFENEKDYYDFAELIKQKLTIKTKSIWYPYKPHRREVQKKWV